MTSDSIMSAANVAMHRLAFGEDERDVMNALVERGPLKDYEAFLAVKAAQILLRDEDVWTSQ